MVSVYRFLFLKFKNHTIILPRTHFRRSRTGFKLGSRKSPQSFLVHCTERLLVAGIDLEAADIDLRIENNCPIPEPRSTLACGNPVATCTTSMADIQLLSTTRMKPSNIHLPLLPLTPKMSVPERVTHDARY